MTKEIERLWDVYDNNISGGRTNQTLFRILRAVSQIDKFDGGFGFGTLKLVRAATANSAMQGDLQGEGELYYQSLWDTLSVHARTSNYQHVVEDITHTVETVLTVQAVLRRLSNDATQPDSRIALADRSDNLVIIRGALIDVALVELNKPESRILHHAANTQNNMLRLFLACRENENSQGKQLASMIDSIPKSMVIPKIDSMSSLFKKLATENRRTINEAASTIQSYSV